MVTFDFDDAHDRNDPTPWLRQLKEINGDFCCTLFAVPGLCSEEWCESMPEWVELAVHGWKHPDPYECKDWTKRQLHRSMYAPIVRTYFVTGFKAPGWQISDAVYEGLLEHGWWVADQHLEDGRRPDDLPVYFYEDGNWHGHVQNVCGNGIQETWPKLQQAVRDATDFRFCSENLAN